jgi:hypothetical protein
MHIRQRNITAIWVAPFKQAIASAVGARAVGALAVGAGAFGALAIARLHVQRAAIEHLYRKSRDWPPQGPRAGDPVGMPS